MPKRLREGQIDDYRTQGFVSPVPVMSAAEVAQ